MKIVITFLLLAILLPCIATAHDFEVDGIYYRKNGINVTVTYRESSYYSYSDRYYGDVIIPTTVTYDGTTYTITQIGTGAFYGCTELNSVTIPNTVEIIDSYAFYGCSGLTSITIPRSIKIISSFAFHGCSAIETLYFNAISCNDFISSDGHPFNNLNISTIIIGNGVQKIPASFAYSMRKLTNVIIPSSVTAIGDGAFSHCRSITNITIPNSVISIGKYAFNHCSRLTSITIPNSVRTIGINAFENCTEMTDVILSNSIQRIECLVFAECTNLVNILMPNSVQYINNKAFKNCTGLKNISFPSSIKAIGNGAFDGCIGLYSIVIPDSTRSLGGNMLSGTAEYWNNGPFSGCTGLTHVTIGESVSSIYDNTFKGCTNISKLTWNAIDCSSNGNMPTLNIEQVLVGDRVKSLPSNFVKDSKITNVIIPDSVVKIYSNAFSNCRKLKNITIPYSVTFIGNEAFYYCEDLTDVTCLAKTPPTMGDYNGLFPAYQMATLHVPERSVNAYKATDWWNCFLAIKGDANDGNPTDDLDYMKCDTNGDGEVNIADVNRVIDAILSH